MATNNRILWSLGRPHYLSDARFDCRRQRRPGINHGRQFGVQRGFPRSKCAVFSATLGRELRIHREIARMFASPRGYCIHSHSIAVARKPRQNRGFSMGAFAACGSLRACAVPDSAVCRKPLDLLSPSLSRVSVRLESLGPAGDPCPMQARRHFRAQFASSKIALSSRKSLRLLSTDRGPASPSASGRRRACRRRAGPHGM